MQLTFTSAKEAEKLWKKVNRKRIKLAKAILWGIWAGVSYAGFFWIYFRMLGFKPSGQFSEHYFLESLTLLNMILFAVMAGAWGIYSLYPTRSDLKAKLKEIEENEKG